MSKQIWYLDFDGTITTEAGSSNDRNIHFGLDLLSCSPEEIKAKFKPGMVEVLKAMLEREDDIVIVTNQVFPQVVYHYLSAVLTPEQIAKIQIKTAPIEKLQYVKQQKPIFNEKEDSTILELLKKPNFTEEEAKRVIKAIDEKSKKGKISIFTHDKIKVIKTDIEQRKAKGETITSENVAFYDDNSINIYKVRGLDEFNEKNAPDFAKTKQRKNAFTKLLERPETNSHVFHMFDRMERLISLNLSGLLTAPPCFDETLITLLREMRTRGVNKLKRSNKNSIRAPFFIDDMVYQVSDSVELLEDGSFRITLIPHEVDSRFGLFSQGKHSKIKQTITVKLTDDNNIEIVTANQCVKIHTKRYKSENGLEKARRRLQRRTKREANRLSVCNGLDETDLQVTIKQVPEKHLVRAYQYMPILGQTLKSFYKSGAWDRLDARTQLGIISKILTRVQFIHNEMKLKHLDLSWENILINEKHDIFIVDFGSAMQTEKHTKTKIKPALVHPHHFEKSIPLTQKDDIGQIGILIAQLAGFKRPKICKETINDDGYHTNTKLSSFNKKLIWDLTTKGNTFSNVTNVIAFFKGLVNFDGEPNDRPDIDEAFDKFTCYFTTCSDIPVC